MLPQVHAAPFTYNFTTTATPTDWSTGTGWTAVPVSAADTSLIFGAGASLLAGDVITSNNNLGTFQLNNLTFSYAGPATGTQPTVTVTGGTLNFVSNGGTGPTLNLNATGTVAPKLLVTSAVTLTDTLTVSGSSSATIGGSVSGAGGITNSSGSLELAGANSYDGVTTINGGTVRISNSQALGTTTGATLVNGNGVLELFGGITVTGESLTIKGANANGNVRNEGGNNTWAGDIRIESSVVGAENVRIVSNSGKLTITGNIVLALETAVADQFVVQGAGDGEVSGNISGTGRLVKSVTGTGTWTLSGTNTYSGPTTISGGTLQFAKRVSLYNADTTQWTAANINVGAAGALALNVGGTGEFTAVDLTELMDMTVTAGGALTLDTTNATGGVFDANVSISNSALRLIKSGNGVLVLSAANAYIGTTNVTRGTLRVQHDNALGTAAAGTSVATGATLEIVGMRTITGESLAIVGEGVGNQGALIVSGNSNAVWAGNISASGGSLTRIGVGMATGDTSSLTVNGNISSTITAANGIVFQGNGTVTVNGVISGANAQITRSSNGTGVLVLTGANTYTGATTVSNGTLQVGVAGVGSLGATSVSLGFTSTTQRGALAGTGSLGGLVTVANGAIISPGDSAGAGTGSLTLNAGLTLNPTGGALFRYNLDTTTSSDKIIITGGIFTGNTTGTNTFAFTTGAGFDNGTYDLIDWSNLAASATGVDIADFTYTGIDASKLVQFQITNNVLQIVVTPEPGKSLLAMLGVLTVFMGRRRSSRARE